MMTDPAESNPLKFKRDIVTPEMRARLLRNRDGRLLPAQWLDLATEPLVILLILLPPAIFLFGPRVMSLFRVWWLLALVAFVVLVVPLFLRAVRYARAPIYYARLRAPEGGVRRWMPWRAQQFVAPNDVVVKFGKRLAPTLHTTADHEYMVYYLDDPAGKVLLSLAPADHEHAELWTPTKGFRMRHAQRTGKPLAEDDLT
ncbi:MAG: hypothetical protein SGJ24_15190 [Chloroflexota bacterium]|nr:hypothetical protein [Chloroflexota bacterium]